MSDFSYNSDYSQYKGISWFEFDDADATTIDTSVDSDEHEDDREVPRGVRAYQNDDRLPQACYGEAERERPEPERSLNVGAPLSIRAHEIPLGTKPPSDAHSTIYRGVQQELYSIFNDLEGFVCGLEYNHDIVKGKLFYRKKVLTRQKVGQRDLCKLIDEKRAQAIVLDKEAVRTSGVTA
ncbi:hypothetical protein MPH_09257 [Macrophomina phaseolina MS6]|uniref:Uncharacterized protein n=1 Tax=Macrophomina phaseolina (strain MS6) TaxID=1126212 RepID=K2S9M1_MACPH|nr:hypothetical protein MPH_09257 [Macrophomina phaseolina MS6]